MILPELSVSGLVSGTGQELKIKSRRWSPSGGVEPAKPV